MGWLLGLAKNWGRRTYLGGGDCGDFETGIKCSINFVILHALLFSLGVIKQSFECSKFADGEGAIVQAHLRQITPHELQGNYFASVAAIKS